jgi:hypothetical protein
MQEELMRFGYQCNFFTTAETTLQTMLVFGVPTQQSHEQPLSGLSASQRGYAPVALAGFLCPMNGLR